MVCPYVDGKIIGNMIGCDNGHRWDVVDGSIITQHTDSTGGQYVDCTLNFIQGLELSQILIPVEMLRPTSHGY